MYPAEIGKYIHFVKRIWVDKYIALNTRTQKHQAFEWSQTFKWVTRSRLVGGQQALTSVQTQSHKKKIFPTYEKLSLFLWDNQSNPQNFAEESEFGGTHLVSNLPTLMDQDMHSSAEMKEIIIKFNRILPGLTAGDIDNIMKRCLFHMLKPSQTMLLAISQ